MPPMPMTTPPPPMPPTDAADAPMRRCRRCVADAADVSPMPTVRTWGNVVVGISPTFSFALCRALRVSISFLSRPDEGVHSARRGIFLCFFLLRQSSLSLEGIKRIRQLSWQKCRIGHELSISRGSQWLFDEPSHPKGCPDSCPLMRRSSRREPPCLSVRLSVCRVAQDGRVVPLDGHPAIRCPPGAPANTLRPWAAAIALEPDDADTLDGKGAYAQVERAAGNLWMTFCPQSEY